ncbi:hypothetical protein F2Q68_00031654 [Brassica cretica]|uniref:Uncharacterized protein n=1 Tax=Brassica cretica TaxID=69181 RepID=A0A8S9GK25_BRACR|nr:hypothetical protein F2Q68_00031654 [Brassica cretica]
MDEDIEFRYLYSNILPQFFSIPPTPLPPSIIQLISTSSHMIKKSQKLIQFQYLSSTSATGGSFSVFEDEIKGSTGYTKVAKWPQIHHSLVLDMTHRPTGEVADFLWDYTPPQSVLQHSSHSASAVYHSVNLNLQSHDQEEPEANSVSILKVFDNETYKLFSTLLTCDSGEKENDTN